MNWIKLTKDNVPDNEIIAYGYQGEMLVGWVSRDGHGGFQCESDETLLEEVTHFCLKTEPKD